MTAIHYPEPDVVADRPAPSLGIAAPPPPEHRVGRTTMLIGAALVVAVAAAAWVWVAGSSSPNPTVDAIGFAEMYVHTYLSQAGEGNEAAVAPFLGYEPDLDGMAAGSFYVVGANAITSIEEGDVTTILVAVDQLGAVAGGFAPQGIHYYRVAVERTGNGARALGLPAQVAAPPIAVAASNRPAFASPTPSPMTEAVEAYLRWYLTGADGAYAVDRPAERLYEDIILLGITAPTEEGAAEVLVSASDAEGRTVHLQYRLHVTNESGMWVAGPAR